MIKIAATWVWISAKTAKVHVLETMAATDPAREQKSLKRRFIHTGWIREAGARRETINPSRMDEWGKRRRESCTYGWISCLTPAHTASQATSSVAQVVQTSSRAPRKECFPGGKILQFQVWSICKLIYYSLWFLLLYFYFILLAYSTNELECW